MIQKAKANGSYVVVIDPIYTKTAQLANEYIAVKPGGDEALVLAMTKLIFERKLEDRDYIKHHVEGFEAYRDYISQLDFEKLCEMSGVSQEKVIQLAMRYAQDESTILLGYGMQKYKNGGNIICLIDTLGAITGQIGKSGGGVNYANRVYPGKLDLDPYKSECYGESRFFYVSDMSSFIVENSIKMAVVMKSNLLNQLPDLSHLETAFNDIEFKVCFDQFLTDTAQACDLFIPCSTVLESEDLLFSSMTNPYLTYNEKALEPKEALMDEYMFYQALAKKVNLSSYPKVSKKEYLDQVILPLKADYPELDLEYFKTNYFTLHESVAWKNQKFLTPSGKFEIHFDKEIACEVQDQTYPFRLLTNHSRDALFSQHFMDEEGRAKAYINSRMADQMGVLDQEIVYLELVQGKIEVVLEISDEIGDWIVMMCVGWWKKHGNPNVLTVSGISDLGGQVTYNETRVKIYNL